MHDYRRLAVWQKARAFTISIYDTTAEFPDSERYGLVAQMRYGLVAQMRRAAVSIVTNIAEGAGRGSDADFARFVRFAIGSSNELECQLDLSVALGYLAAEAGVLLDEELGHIRAMLLRLNKSLASKTPTEPRP